MRRFIAAVVLGSAFVGTALAANVQFKTHHEPVYSDEGTTLSVTACLTGLGNGDVFIDLDATGIAETECHNPAGNHAPGQDETISAGGELLIPESEIKNGTVCFTVETDEPRVTSTEAECPNRRWSAEVIDVEFLGGNCTIEQGGEIVLTDSF